MFYHLPTALSTILTQISVRSIRRYIYRLGGIGFIPLGFLDASLIPIPGSMDVLIIVLASRRGDLWIYYALMATAGAVLGGFITFRLARKGGKEMLAKKVSERRLKSVYRIFEKWGFASIAIPALLPPPIPMVPFVLAAGAMQYSTQKFLAALTLGRVVRFTVLGFLAARYGRGIIRYVTQHGHPVVVTTIGVIVTAAAVYFLVMKVKRQAQARA